MTSMKSLASTSGTKSEAYLRPYTLKDHFLQSPNGVGCKYNRNPFYKKKLDTLFDISANSVKNNTKPGPFEQ